ncbi:hypothetical protein EVJ58_g7290 [Rhodofomes roseus]|uniref:asparaginase n=1 Tax=Rhodofomes roseus TaxID=34475 RepID=A0A4Y9Y3F7_9APHY|nr:hypothetical protein EVJ58_g7290 [Rhodofomes roseus]
MDVLQATDESKVLILNTGGTINMILGQRGYVPEPYFLTESLRTQNRFHDPLEDSLFSHSSSVEGYREWTSNSGRASPISKSGGSSTSGATQPNHQHHPTLLVRSTRPIGMSVTANLAATAVNTTYPRPPLGTKLADDLYEAHLPSLITPRSTAPGGTQKRVRYAVLEAQIELNYAGFDAFVILHGTDTMSYTSSALSFLLEDLGKTVIVTGAQIPLSQLRNDAVDNLLGALVLAGHYIIPECCLYFNHTLYRGNRVSKFSSYDLNAFASPNFPPLVNGITAATVRAFLAPPTQGVVLETYGAGNAPQRSDLIGALKEACDRGVVIVSISQCAKGSVSDAYETGRSLLSAGVVSGGDMTPECALTKLGYLLSKPELSRSEVRALIGTPLRGELTRPVSTIPPAISEPKGIESNLENISGVLSQVVRLSSSQARGPSIVVSSAEDTGAESNLEAAAPWSWTAAEAASTEGALYPFLIHLAAARNDVEAIQFCLKAEAGLNADDATSPGAEFPSQTRRSIAIGGGLVNCVEPASGRSPLHSAALNGSTDAVNALLEAGALVHLRDSLGHTPLYYAARQGHEQVVEMLVKVGGLLSGSDVEGGFVGLAMQKARLAPDDRGLRVWTKAGADPQHTT